MLYDASNIGKFYKNSEMKKKEALPGIWKGVSPATPSFTGNISEALTGGGPTQSSGASRFVNFERVLSANQPGAAEMAGKVYKGTEGKATKAEEGIKGLGAEFQKQSEANKIRRGADQILLPESGSLTGRIVGKPFDPYNPPPPEEDTRGTVTEVGEGVKGLPQTGAAIGTPGGKGISIAEAQKLAEQQYKGPENLSKLAGYQQTQTDIQKALDALSASNQPGAVEAQLNELYGTAGGTGGSRLDAALAQVGLGDSLKGLKGRFSNLEKMLEQADQTAQSRYQDELKNAEDVRRIYADMVSQAQAEQAFWDEIRKEQEKQRKEEEERAKDVHIIAE